MLKNINIGTKIHKNNVKYVNRKYDLKCRKHSNILNYIMMIIVKKRAGKFNKMQYIKLSNLDSCGIETFETHFQLRKHRLKS